MPQNITLTHGIIFVAGVLIVFASQVYCNKDQAQAIAEKEVNKASISILRELSTMNSRLCNIEQQLNNLSKRL